MVSTAGGIVIAIVVILVAAVIGWLVFSQLRARRLGVSFSLLFLLILPAALHFPCLERQAMIRRRMAIFGSIAKPLRERRQSNDTAATN